MASIVFLLLFTTLNFIIITTNATQQQTATVGQLTTNRTAPSIQEHLQDFELKCSNGSRFTHPTINLNELIESSPGRDFSKTPNECKREPTAWRWLYIYENLPNSRILIRDSSIDKRVANLHYTLQSAPIIYDDGFSFDSGDRELDARNEQRVAGARVDDKLCGEHLAEMLKQIEDFEGKLSTIRRELLEKKTNNNNNNKKQDSVKGLEDDERSLLSPSKESMDEKYLYLAKVLDAFGRYESGLLQGRKMFVGDYGTCNESKLALNKSQPLQLTRTRFCWARMKFHKETLDVSLKERKLNIMMQEPLISSGICIPSSCHTRNFKQYRHLFERIVTGQFKLPNSLYIQEQLELDSIFCQVDKDSEFLSSIPFSGRLLILLLVLWFSLIIWATYKNANNTSKSSLARCVDVQQSWLEFTEQQESRHKQAAAKANKSDADQQVQSQLPSRRLVDLNTLNFLKVALCAYVVVGHCSMVHLFYSQDRVRGNIYSEFDPIATGILAGTFFVDTFLTIASILTAWGLLRKIDSSKGRLLSSIIGYIRLYLGFVTMRYLRLVPLYFLIIWFKKSLFKFLWTGPFWDYGFNKNTSIGACEHTESWLTPLTMTSCYLPLFRQCVTPSWSIALDFQLCLLVVPIILLSYRYRRLAKLMLVSGISACVCMGYKSITSIEPEIQEELIDGRFAGVGQFFNKHSILYTSPKLRFCNAMVGALAGILLYEFEKKNQTKTTDATNEEKAKVDCKTLSPSSSSSSSSSRLSSVTSNTSNIYLTLATVWIAYFFVSIINMPWLRNQLSPYHSIMLINVVVLRANWSISNAIIIYYMAIRWKGSLIIQFNSMRLWKILSKLNLAILLIHWDLLLFYHQNQIGTFNLERWNWLTIAAGVYLTSFILGTIIHVCIENSLDRLIRHYLYGEKFARNQAGETESANGSPETSTNKTNEQDNPIEKKQE